jgi:hypothetical protein
MSKPGKLKRDNKPVLDIISDDQPDVTQQLLYSDKFIINSVLENKYKTIGSFLMGCLITLVYFSGTSLLLTILINAIKYWFINLSIIDSSSLFFSLLGIIFVGFWCFLFSMLTLRMVQKLYLVFKHKNKSFKLKIFFILVIPTILYLMLIFFAIRAILQIKVTF